MFSCMYVCVPRANSVCKGQNRMSDPQIFELEILTTVWVLGTKSWSLERTVCDVNCWSITPAPPIYQINAISNYILNTCLIPTNSIISHFSSRSFFFAIQGDYYRDPQLAKVQSWRVGVGSNLSWYIYNANSYTQVSGNIVQEGVERF